MSEPTAEQLETLAEILPKLEAGTHEFNADGQLVEK